MAFIERKIINMSTLSVSIKCETDLISLKSSIFSSLSDMSDQASKLILVSCNESYELDADSSTIFLSEIISEKLLSLSQSKRKSAVEDLVEELIETIDSPYVILKRIHVLFEPSLEIDPLKLLIRLAKYKNLIVFWPGVCVPEGLSISNPGQKDYHFYSVNDLNSIPIIQLVEHGE